MSRPTGKGFAVTLAPPTSRESRYHIAAEKVVAERGFRQDTRNPNPLGSIRKSTLGRDELYGSPPGLYRLTAWASTSAGVNATCFISPFANISA